MLYKIIITQQWLSTCEFLFLKSYNQFVLFIYIYIFRLVLDGLSGGLKVSRKQE